MEDNGGGGDNIDIDLDQILEAQFPDEEMEESDDESAEEEPANVRAGRKRKYNSYNWVDVQVFNSQKEQDDYFEQNSFWKKESTRTDRTGTKTRYYCNEVSRYKGLECPAKLLLFAPKDMAQNTLSRNGVQHAHEEEGQQPRKKPMDEATGRRIKELLMLNKQPRIISHILRTDGNIVDKPTISQVRRRFYNINKQIVQKCEKAVLLST